MTTLDLNGERFHIRIDGPEDAPVLFLSNSLSSDLTMWDEQVKEWSRTHRVVRYDSRGHGRSPAPARPYSIAELGRDALAIMNALELDRVNWCGLSKGGMVGMWVATHAPERLNRLVLANTSPHMGPPDLWNGRIRTARGGGMEALVDATVTRWFTKRFLDGGPAAIPLVRAMILGTPAAGYMGCCAAIRDMDQREAIRSVSVPTLVIAGKHDPATTWETGEGIHKAIAGSSFVTLDAAHLSNIERPAEFTAAVSTFLAG